MVTFTPAGPDGYIGSGVYVPYGGTNEQIGSEIAGDNGLHYTVTWGFDGPALICSETGVQSWNGAATLTSGQFVTDQMANGYPGIGFFVPAYGCVGIANTPYAYVWATSGGFLFGQPTTIVFLRYHVRSDGSITPDGGSLVQYQGAGGNRPFCMNTSGGNGTVWGANVIDGNVYFTYISQVNPGGTGAGSPCMACIPFTNTYSGALLVWEDHNINLHTAFGDSLWWPPFRGGDTNVNMTCLVDNGDHTGSCIMYQGLDEIATSPNANVNTLPHPTFLTYDFRFTPSALSGSWTIGSLYAQTVSGITFPFTDTGKNLDGSAGSIGDDYLSPSVLLISGTTYLAVPRNYIRGTDFPPGDVGAKWLLFSYVKGTMTYANGVYVNMPFNPYTHMGYSGPPASGMNSMHAFVSGNNIWGFTTWNGLSAGNFFVYYNIFSFSSPPAAGSSPLVFFLEYKANA